MKMKKFLILLVAFATFSVQYAKAQCTNSDQFSRNLKDYEKLVIKDTFKDLSAVGRMALATQLQVQAVKLLDSSASDYEYATFLATVNLEQYLPVEVLTANTGADIQCPPNVPNNCYLKHLYKAHNVYILRFEKSHFTKSAKKFVKKQVKGDGSVKKDITSYSNYQLFILHHFGGVSFTTKAFDHDAIQSIVAQLKSSNCPAYTKLADEIVKNL